MHPAVGMKKQVTDLKIMLLLAKSTPLRLSLSWGKMLWKPMQRQCKGYKYRLNALMRTQTTCRLCSSLISRGDGNDGQRDLDVQLVEQPRRYTRYKLNHAERSDAELLHVPYATCSRDGDVNLARCQRAIAC